MSDADEAERIVLNLAVRLCKHDIGADCKCLEYTRASLDNYARLAHGDRLKAEGLREGLTRALEISRKHEQALDVEVAIFNEIARADALSPQAKETK